MKPVGRRTRPDSVAVLIGRPRIPICASADEPRKQTATIAASSWFETPRITIATVGPSDWKKEAPQKQQQTTSEARPKVDLPSRGAATRRGWILKGWRWRTVSGRKRTPTKSGRRKDEADDVDELERVRPVLHEDAADQRPHCEAGDRRRRSMRRRASCIAARRHELGQRRGARAREEPHREPGGDAPREQHRDTVREDEEHKAERAEQDAGNEDSPASDPVREIAEQEHGDEDPEEGRRGKEGQHRRREVELPRVCRPEAERHGARRDEHRQPVDDRDVSEPPRQDGTLHR